MIQMNALNIHLILHLILVFQFNGVELKPTPDDDESIVPEDIDDGSILDEDDPGQAGATNLSPSAIEEYMKEHPEVKQLPKPGANGAALPMKRVYNKFGDVVSVPNLSPITTKVESKNKSNYGQMMQPMPMNPMNPFPYPYFNPYLMNPYLSQQSIGIPPQIPGFPPQQQPQPPQPGSPVTPQEMAKYQLKPRTESGEQTKSETEVNEKIYQMIRNQEMSKFDANGTANGPPMGPFGPFPPFQNQMMPGMPPMMGPMGPMMSPYPPPFLNPNQFKIDDKNIKVMPFPNGVVMDPTLLNQLQSGSAQLDMANARVIPMEATTQEPLPMTESETLDERPELPEVVLPKPKPTPKSTPKARYNGKRMSKRKHLRQRHKHEVRKPHFLMRARLNKLPKKDQKMSGNEWWTKSVPKLCNEPIIEITNCKGKHLEKRWSFNKSDEKCYLYEDLCYKIKKNTFKSLKDCMIACWRPK